MKIIVTGPTGYLAKSLISYLKELDHEVNVLTFNNLDPEDYSIILEDVNLKKCDVVINCAAAQLSGSTPSEIQSLVNANIYWPSIILHALKVHKNRPSFIHIGTQWQTYDDANDYPFNYYAATKSALEPILQNFALDGIKTAVVLLSDLVGPKDYRNKMHCRVIDALRNNTTFETTGGEQYMNLIHVNDACSGIQTVMDLLSKIKENTTFNKYNLCTANHIKVKELILELAFRLNQYNVGEIVKFGSLKYRDREKFNPLHSEPNIPGWYPRYSTSEIIDELAKS